MGAHIRILIAVFFVAGALYLTGASLPEKTAEVTGFYKVMQVTDGDTIVILKDGKRVPVRLLGIDAPEVPSPYANKECFGTEASLAAYTLFEGADVRIETDPTQDMYDQYGRLLAYVYVPARARPEGLMANEYLLSEGFAREYTYRKPYTHQSEFVQLENDAKSNSRGLWGVCP